ncbi:ABC transporter substrate-binding protein [Secundilactobacillus odoratitofui]|uniref:ABC transporter substrate-binding protein n=1 Tax=Secundilactobacillus odoratitofui TaxID=480930 RepID=UPI000AD52F3E|nr:ABC transporter substrate-binding protein [Secundilactobacillus odoratitofui]
MLSDDTDQAKTTTQYLQDQFEKLPGLTVNIDNVPNKNRLARSASGNFDLVVSSWGADFADPINFLSLEETGNSTNNGGWSNKTYDQLIKASQTTNANNPQKRYQNLVDAEKVLMQNQGVIPLYQPATTELWRPNVHGYVWNPAGMSVVIRVFISPSNVQTWCVCTMSIIKKVAKFSGWKLRYFFDDFSQFFKS